LSPAGETASESLRNSPVSATRKHFKSVRKQKEKNHEKPQKHSELQSKETNNEKLTSIFTRVRDVVPADNGAA